MPKIDVDDRTARAVEFAAKIARITPGEVIARLVDGAALAVPVFTEQELGAAGSEPHAPASHAVSPANIKGRVRIHADYEGMRTLAWFSPTTHEVDIEEGPLAGHWFASPSAAARAVVHRLKPQVDPNRNGWLFWIVSSSGDSLDSLRDVD